MDVHDFRDDLLEETKITAATQGEGSDAAFTEIVASYLVNSEVIPDFSPAFYNGTGKNNRRIRVDGYVFDDFDQSFTLVISDYTGEKERDTVTQSYASTLFDRLLYFVEEAYGSKLPNQIEPSTAASDLIQELNEFKERTRKFRLLLFTDGLMSSRITEIAISEFMGLPVERQIWDVDRIFRVCFSESGRQDIEIDFATWSNSAGIPCIEASSANTQDYKSYLCIIPGELLADIYDRYGSQLLEGNVRSFLSTKVAVNRKIRETILRIPQNFFAYNNGISATAMELRFKSTSSGRYITYAKDFQIINGGQTTASLSNARYKDNADLSQIYVQMKLTEVDSDAEKSTELIRNISRSSNSQNKVSDADFFATHPFHVRMEQKSVALTAPAVGGAQFGTKWFYERARGQYHQKQMRSTRAEKARFVAQHPRNQVITKTDLAKVRNSWRELPHIVSKGAQTNFMQFAAFIDESWSKSDIEFNDKYYRDTVSLSILFKHTEKLVSHQPWYGQGYRANIVTYSLSLLHRLIVTQFKGMDLDLHTIWSRQQVPDIISAELIKITKHVFDSITAPNRITANVTQWCKREECWNLVKDCDIKLSAEMERLLISKEAKLSKEKDARNDQAMVSDIEAQSEVFEKGAELWKSLKLFVENKRIPATARQLEALRYASQIPSKVPSSYQSIQVLNLLKKAISEGFKQ